MQARRNDQFLSVCDESPDQLVLSEVCGNAYCEHSPLTACEEVCRLALIGSTAIDAIVGPDRNIQFLFRIAIEVPEDQVERSIRILEPTFERAGDARAGFVDRLERQRLRADEKADRCGQDYAAQ
jgi:hypothetical protein